MQVNNHSFREIWCVDFEFSAAEGDTPSPICMVALELNSGRKIRLWEDELRSLRSAPYATDVTSLFVAYYASAEMNCHLALGWEMPENVLDLYVEFRNFTNGKQTPFGTSLLGALTHFGINGIGAAEKDSMRDLAMRGGPWTDDERDALLDYCESDVVALPKLLSFLSDHIDVPRAVHLRGRYMKTAAQIERNGVPVDTEHFNALDENWSRIQEGLIAEIDKDYGVYEGKTFKADKRADYLIAHEIPWTRLQSGRLALDDETFKQMARIYPEVAPIRELRSSLAQMRLSSLAVGSDERTRCMLSVFQSKTGRNQPSNSKFIFGPSVWLRSLIRPKEGYGIAYIDWSQQEFGIAAALSNDERMIEAYESGDPYIAFAKQAGAAPEDATKETHGAVREQFKQCVLAVQYGMGAESLAFQIGQPVARARQLLRMHRDTYTKYWQWSQAIVDHAMLYGSIQTVFGWKIHVGESSNARSLANFPMQANGAEMLRIACCFATEQGIKVCAPIHDAILIEAPLSEFDEAIEKAQLVMSYASAVVLSGFRLRSEAKVFRYPERYMDERGERMWNTVWKLIGDLN